MGLRTLRALRAQLRATPSAAAHPLPAHDGTPASAEAGCGVVATTDRATLLRDFKQHGFCILADAIPGDEVAKLRASAVATAERHNGWHAALDDDEIRGAAPTANADGGSFEELPGGSAFEGSGGDISTKKDEHDGKTGGKGLGDSGLKTAGGISMTEAHMWHVGGVLRHDQSFAPQIANENLLPVLEDAFDTPRSDLLVTCEPAPLSLTPPHLGGFAHAGAL
eukprot:COSAG04_NODE_583_length_12401_cov_6.259307_2_plen_223_part_00